MSTNSSEIFDLIERCHTILADLFPHEGLLAIGGSRVFVRTNLFVVLKKCIGDIRGSLAKTDPAGIVALFWNRAADLVDKMEKKNTEENSNDINEAARLLYFGSGLTWNFLRQQVPGDISHNANYVRVETVRELLARCGQNDQDMEQIAPDVLLKDVSLKMTKFFA